MRRFLLLAHRVPVNGAFTLNDLAGGAGRMDEVARVVSTAFTLSNDLRRDTELTILFEAEPAPAARQIRLEGARLRHLNPDERSTAALLKNALVRSIPMEHDVEASPGLVVGPVEPAEAIRTFALEPGAFWLSEGGIPLRALTGTGDGFAAILSDPTDPPPNELEFLRSTGIPRVSLGPVSMRSSQCVDVLHNEFDLRAAARAPARAASAGPVGSP
jgi:tRNA (pseudouridine54-N1)-methyltransferase